MYSNLHQNYNHTPSVLERRNTNFSIIENKIQSVQTNINISLGMHHTCIMMNIFSPRTSTLDSKPHVLPTTTRTTDLCSSILWWIIEFLSLLSEARKFIISWDMNGPTISLQWALVQLHQAFSSRTRQSSVLH